MEERKYTAKEVAETAKKIAHVFDAYETYAHFSTKSDRAKNAEEVLEVIREYKEGVPKDVRKYLDNSDELTLNFKGIGDLEKTIKSSLGK